MRYLKFLVLYAGLALGANPVVADTGALIALAQGDLGQIRFHAKPRAVSELGFTDANGATVNLSSYRGKHVLVNFWALWCAPCVKEMPSLERLDATLGGTDFEVVTIATGRNARPAIDKFFVKKDIKHLPKLFDPKMALIRDMGGAGLPMTVLIGPDGLEIGRMQGEAEWDSPAALALLQAWVSGT